MNKYIKLLAGAVVVSSLWSCSKDDEPQPWLQSWPVITLEGEAEEYAETGTDYVLPGFTALNTIDGSDASDRVVVEIYDNISGRFVNAISTATPGMYTVYYTCLASEVTTNPGISTQRTVYVYNPAVTTDIAGKYNVNMSESCKLDFADGAFAPGQDFVYWAANYGVTDQYFETITQIAPGFFKFSDLFGGWYVQGRGYDSKYACVGYLSLNEDNTISLLSSSVAGWGDSATGFENGKYDPETGVISWDVYYVSNLAWRVVLE